jgi:hypothetical protein
MAAQLSILRQGHLESIYALVPHLPGPNGKNDIELFWAPHHNGQSSFIS